MGAPTVPQENSTTSLDKGYASTVWQASIKYPVDKRGAKNASWELMVRDDYVQIAKMGDMAPPLVYNHAIYARPEHTNQWAAKQSV